MERNQVIDSLLKNLESELDRVVRASNDARDYATDEESRAESQWDTHGLEASYLAAGTAKVAQEMVESIRSVQALRQATPGPTGRAVTGSLIEVKLDGRTDWFLLATAGGGEALEVDGQEITVVTPQSPIGSCVLGKGAGEAFTLPNGLKGRVISVQ